MLKGTLCRHFIKFEIFEKKIEKKTKNENFESLIMPKKLERGDPSGFLKLQFAAKHEKK